MLRSSVSNGRPYCFCKVSFSLFFFFFLLVFSQTRGRIWSTFCNQVYNKKYLKQYSVSVHEGFLVTCYVIREFRGQKVSIFGHEQLENLRYFEKHLITKVAQNDALNNMHFIFSINNPIRELRGRPLKFSFLNNSKTVKNF